MRRLARVGVCALLSGALALADAAVAHAQVDPGATYRTLETSHFRVTYEADLEDLARHELGGGVHAGEFRQFVEKQNAEMRQADFARPHPQAAASERGHAGRMMRRAERTAAAEKPAFEHAGDRRHHAHFQRFCWRKLGQYAWKAACQQALARARRPDHQQVVPAGRGNLERALGRLLSLHSPQVGPVLGFRDFALCGLGQRLRALEVVEQADQVRRGAHGDAAGPARFAALCGRADQPLAGFARMQRRQQHARRGGNPPVEREFAHRDPVIQLLGIGHAHRHPTTRQRIGLGRRADRHPGAAGGPVRARPVAATGTGRYI